MFSSLKGCSIVGLSAQAQSSAMAWAGPLLHQARALGLGVLPDHQTQGAFQFQVPGLKPVVCEASAWPNAQGLGSEFLMQAACGLMSVHGRSSGQLQPLGVDYLSVLFASVLLQGTLAGALGQARGLPIQQVSSAWVSSGVLALGQYIAGATVGVAPERLLPACASAMYRPPFVSNDGVVFELEALDAKPWRAFWTALGLPLDVAGRSWTAFLMRYAKAISPLDPVLMDALAALPYAYIAQLCEQTGMSICPARGLGDRLAEGDAQVLLQQGPWFFEPLGRVNVAEAIVRGVPAGQGLPLSGLRVVESCRRIQGPLAGHLLALLGAEVVRIEPVGGDLLRGMPPLAGEVSARFDALNGLKQVREIDIKSTEGQAEVRALVSQADVFLHNWAPSKAAALNLDVQDLHAVNPALVYAYAGGWGPACVHDLPGTDFMVQAHSGLGDVIAKASGTRGGSLFTVLDVLGGVMASQGVVAALLARQLEPQGVFVRSSLEGAAMALCASCSDAFESKDQGSMLRGVYATAQGHVAIDMNQSTQWKALAEGLGLSVNFQANACLAELSQALLENTAQHWLVWMQARGIPCALVVEDLSSMPQQAELQGCFSMGDYARVRAPWSFS